MQVARFFSESQGLARLAQTVLLGLAATVGACADTDTLPVSPDMRPSFAKGGSTKPAVEKILVAKGDTNGNTPLYTVNPDGTGLTQLTAGPAFNPDYSPNRKKIVFWRYARNVPSADKRIILMNANGTMQTEIGVGYAPRFSPDGTKILFTRQDSLGFGHLWVMNADGSNPTQLTPAQLHQYYGAWSGDGSMIVFSGGYPGQPFEVFTVQANGANITQRTNCGAEMKNCFLGDASPLASDLRFTYTKAPRVWSGNGDTIEIRAMKFDGSNDGLLLTDTEALNHPVMAFSSDGTRIVFNSAMTYGHHGDLHVMHANGTGAQAITNFPATWVYGLAW